MPVLSGNTSGSIACQTFDIPVTIKSIRVVNRTAGAITTSILINDGQERYIKTFSLAANASGEDDIETRVIAGWQIIIITGGSTDYYITVDK